MKLIHIIVIIAASIYVISPIDAVPGPIDDIIVAILTTVITIVTSKKKAIEAK